MLLQPGLQPLGLPVGLMGTAVGESWHGQVGQFRGRAVDIECGRDLVAGLPEQVISLPMTRCLVRFAISHCLFDRLT